MTKFSKILPSLFVFICITFAFTTSDKTQRTIEGRVLDAITKQPIETEIVLYRQGKTWNIKSTDKGWYAISLPSEKAYAVKIYNNDYKNHVSAFYLEINEATDAFEHDILLAPTE
ncbi:MAG: hypothetical protein AB8G11_18455 [Saprospiraceae bacterium]